MPGAPGTPGTPGAPGTPGTPGTPAIPGNVTQVWACEGIRSRGQAIIFCIPVSFGQAQSNEFPNQKVAQSFEITWVLWAH